MYVKVYLTRMILKTLWPIHKRIVSLDGHEIVDEQANVFRPVKDSEIDA